MAVLAALPTGTTARPAGGSQYCLVSDALALAEALPRLLAAPRVGLDTETTGLDSLGDRLRLVQLAIPGQVYVVDCFTRDPRLLTPLMEQGRCFAGHNLVFDLRFLLANGLPMPDGDRLFDTMLASQLLQAGLPEPRGTHTLAAVAERVLGITLDNTEQRSDWAGELSDSQLGYAANDAAVLLPLVAALDQQLAAVGLTKAAAIEFRALPTVTWLEHSGASFDQERWLALSDAAVAEQLRLEAELATVSGTGDLFGGSTVNWSSPDQVARPLRQRGHAVERTDEGTLQRLAADGPLARLPLAYREASRKASSYGVEFVRHVHAATGRIHADFVQIGAASGRMACSNPNLQNIPRDLAYRACFAAPPGRALVKADYSQIELRIAAQISGDPALLAAYGEGSDVHVRTAAAMLGIAEAAVTKQQRQLAKALNFGLIYGMGAERLVEHAATQFGIQPTVADAAHFRDRFFAAYPGLRRWHRGQPREDLDTRTLSERRRLGVHRFTEKVNTPVHGTGADILKLALARLWEDRAAQPSAQPLLCVHDEIVVECDADQAEAAADRLTNHMAVAAVELLPDVPVIVDVAIAADWSGLSFAKREGDAA